MNPIAINLGFWQIRWYSLLFVVGLLIGYFITRKIAKKKGLKINIVDNYFIWAIISFILGARIFEVLFYNLEYYLANPIKIFFIWEGGIASHGAILGLAVMTYFFARYHKLRFYQLSDLLVIPAALIAAFVRVGNFINSELIGKITNSIFGIDVNGVKRHPVQLYQSFCNLVVFVFLISMKKFKEGILTWVFIGLYSIFRFTTEFFKELPAGYGTGFWGLNVAQWMSLLGVILSIYFLIKLSKTND